MFLVVTQWMPLRPTADRFDGCFCLGSGPVFGCVSVLFCFLPCFRWRNANLAGGFAGRRFLCGCGFRWFVLIDLLISRTYVLVQCFSCLLSCKDRALARHRPISRKKKFVTGRYCTTIQYTANLTELAYGRIKVSDPLGWDVLDALKLLAGLL